MKLEIELTDEQYNALKWKGIKEGADHNVNGEPFRPETIAQTAVYFYVKEEIEPEMEIEQRRNGGESR